MAIFKYEFPTRISTFLGLTTKKEEKSPYFVIETKVTNNPSSNSLK